MWRTGAVRWAVWQEFLTKKPIKFAGKACADTCDDTAHVPRNEVLPMSFAEKLRSLRKEYNISQKTLAAKLGFNYTTISNYESGRNEPNISTLIRIADIFDVSLDELTDRQWHAHREVRKILQDLCAADELWRK